MKILLEVFCFFKTSRAIRKDLEERFGYASMPQISSLEHKLTDLHQRQQFWSFTQNLRQFGIIWMVHIPCLFAHVRNVPVT